ncbi:MAG: ABC transporter substrate-binding protein [Actinobacteria bacterium]|nr:ABC transporter substrate-binding protein [Actinomycetota bacterium]
MKIGAVLPLSGPISIVGLTQKQAYELFAKETNRNGGLKIGADTYNLQVIVEDGKASPDASATAAKKLIFQDGVSIVIGEILEAPIEAIYQVASTAPEKVLHCIQTVNWPAPNTADVAASKPLQIRLNFSPQDVYYPDLDFLAKQYPDVKTVAIATPSNADTASLQAAIKDHGLQVLGPYEWAYPGTGDFVPLYSKILADKPDAVISVMNGLAPSELKAARDLGFTGPFISTSPNAAEDFVLTAGESEATDLIINGADKTHPNAEMQKFMDLMTAEYGEFNSNSFIGWDTMWTLAQLLQRAGSVDPEKLVSTFESMTASGDVTSLFGAGQVGGMEEYGVNRVVKRPIPVVHVMDGKPNAVAFQLPKIMK